MKRPLSVVSTDQEALSTLLALHAVPKPRILDVTHNRGVMWKGLPYRPHRSDSDASLHAQGFTDTVADFRALPFEDGSFDVLVFDPPHITDAGRTGMVGERDPKGWASRYGTLSEGFKGDSITPVFVPFLREAQRVLQEDSGVVLAKIADQVHGSVYRWQHVDFVNAARDIGLTPCDVLVKIAFSRGGLIDPRWSRICHSRQVHTYWIVLRNGSRCTSRTAPVADRPATTFGMFVA